MKTINSNGETIDLYTATDSDGTITKLNEIENHSKTNFSMLIKTRGNYAIYNKHKSKSPQINTYKKGEEIQPNYFIVTGIKLTNGETKLHYVVKHKDSNDEGHPFTINIDLNQIAPHDAH